MSGSPAAKASNPPPNYQVMVSTGQKCPGRMAQDPVRSPRDQYQFLGEHQFLLMRPNLLIAPVPNHERHWQGSRSLALACKLTSVLLAEISSQLPEVMHIASEAMNKDNRKALSRNSIIHTVTSPHPCLFSVRHSSVIAVLHHTSPMNC